MKLSLALLALSLFVLVACEQEASKAANKEETRATADSSNESGGGDGRDRSVEPKVMPRVTYLPEGDHTRVLVSFVSDDKFPEKRYDIGYEVMMMCISSGTELPPRSEATGHAVLQLYSREGRFNVAYAVPALLLVAYDGPSPEHDHNSRRIELNSEGYLMKTVKHPSGNAVQRETLTFGALDVAGGADSWQWLLEKEHLMLRLGEVDINLTAEEMASLDAVVETFPSK